ncbi:unnamed protein product [Cylicocyclus nassatus]|uniref:Metalloendopeptidase n=1 Tax=Cylicocyclus nassatus TaxID=53992 RepID=A0AA36DPZ4_CYLNA|nr:unnamed protein product [Cylicocyclus nassatus]
MGNILLVLIFIGSSLASGFIGKALSESPETLSKAEETQILAAHEILHQHDNEVKNLLQLSPEQELTLHRIEESLEPLQHYTNTSESISVVNSHSPIGNLLYQSDIELTIQQAQQLANEEAEMIAQNEGATELSRNKRQAAVFGPGQFRAWPNGVLYYSLPVGTDRKIQSIAREAAAIWMRDTCVNLVEDREAEQRVEFNVYAPVCSSLIGWANQGVQYIKFAKGCHYVGTAVHEFGHALGMLHTHSRHDRDDYLFIDPNHIQIGAERNFVKETPESNNNYDIPFDYGSIMAYGARSMIAYSQHFNKESYTMVPKDRNYIDTLGSQFIAFYDVLMMNKMYDCLKKCDGVQQSPVQDRVKRQTTRRVVITTRTSSNGGPPVTQTQTFTSNDGDLSGILSGMNLNGFSHLGGTNSLFGRLMGNLGGMEGGNNGPSNNHLNGHNGNGLKGEEGESTRPGDRGSSTGGWSDWWNLPSIIGGKLPDWIFTIGGNWDWDYTETTTTTRRPPTTPRPTTTTRASTKKPKHHSKKPKTPTPTTTTTTTPAPRPAPRPTPAPVPAPGPYVPSKPLPGPKYNQGKCANGGYPSPRDCSRCACPHGYGGRFCNERPAGPGEILTAKTSVQTIKTSVGHEGVRRSDERMDYVFHYYWIQAPAGRKIEVKIVSIEEKLATEGCTWQAIEIKYQKDQRLTGPRLMVHDQQQQQQRQLLDHRVNFLSPENKAHRCVFVLNA